MYLELTPVKTYKTRENAQKAVEKAGLEDVVFQGRPVRYMIMTHTDGRFYPVFLGEAAAQCGIHFKFNIVG